VTGRHRVQLRARQSCQRVQPARLHPLPERLSRRVRHARGSATAARAHHRRCVKKLAVWQSASQACSARNADRRCRRSSGSAGASEPIHIARRGSASPPNFAPSVLHTYVLQKCHANLSSRGPTVARRSTVVPCPRPSFQLSPPRLPYSPSPMRLASFSSHGCRSETPPTAGAGLKRVRVLSPSSSYESLEAHARHVSARIIQRRWRGLRRSSSGRELDQEPDSPFQAAESVGTDLATHRPLASLALPALTAVAAIIGAVAAGQALALEAPEVRVSQKSACPPTTAALLPPTRAPAPHLALPLPPSELVSHMACAQLSCLARWRRVPYS